MVDVKPGQVFVPGANAKVARDLLAAAHRGGFNPKLAVRTTDGGFVVPQKVADLCKAATRTARILPVDPPPEPKKKPAAGGPAKKPTSKE